MSVSTPKKRSSKKAGNAVAPAAAMADEASPLAANPAGKQTPRRLRRAAEIISAARDTFLEKGFERASVSEIAAKVGVVEGLLYAYFPTKRDMLNEVLRGMYEPLIKEMTEGFNRLHGLRSRLRFLIWRHIRVYVEEPGLSRLVLHEVRTRPEYFNSALHELHVRYTAFLMHTVREAKASGELPADTDEEMVRGMVYGGIEHRMWAVLFGRSTVDVEVATDRFTDMVLRGIEPAPSGAVAGDTGREAPRASGTLDAAALSPGRLAPANDPLASREDIERRLDRLEKIIAASGFMAAAGTTSADAVSKPERSR
ncbi:MAG: TetR/AcrR family transcriptional regulator [Comamonadaceae bacterium]|nr:MAG: TetR/AcrR family transcriptional regulator [Comamonadaceae bacterium]